MDCEKGEAREAMARENEDPGCAGGAVIALDVVLCCAVS